MAAMHWKKYFQHAVDKYNSIYRDKTGEKQDVRHVSQRHIRLILQEIAQEKPCLFIILIKIVDKYSG